MPRRPQQEAADKVETPVSDVGFSQLFFNTEFVAFSPIIFKEFLYNHTPFKKQ